MDNLREFWQNSDRGIKVGILYTGLLCALGTYYNYTMPYDSNPVISPHTQQLVLWTLLYVPLGIFVLMANWNVTEFGFCITPRLGLALLVIIPFCGIMTWQIQITWQSALIEAFARTGEEVFFRGFLFALLLKIFKTKKAPWKWAVVISSLLFALVHVQIFQTSYLNEYGAGPVAYRIFERLFNVFLFGLGWAFLRQWTNSILPGAIIHSILQGGIFTLPFSIIIYSVIAFWAYTRKESTFFMAKVIR